MQYGCVLVLMMLVRMNASRPAQSTPEISADELHFILHSFLSRSNKHPYTSRDWRPL